MSRPPQSPSALLSTPNTTRSFTEAPMSPHLAHHLPISTVNGLPASGACLQGYICPRPTHTRLFLPLSDQSRSRDRTHHLSHCAVRGVQCHLFHKEEASVDRRLDLVRLCGSRFLYELRHYRTKGVLTSFPLHMTGITFDKSMESNYSGRLFAEFIQNLVQYEENSFSSIIIKA